MRLLFTGQRSLLVLLILVGVVGCQSAPTQSGSQPQVGTVFSAFSGGNVTPIREVQPSKQNSTVYLKGKVGAIAPLMGQTAYELQDGTGSIWIVTQATPPQSGTEVQIKGKVRFQSIRLDGAEQGSVYIEQDQGGLFSHKQARSQSS